MTSNATKKNSAAGAIWLIQAITGLLLVILLGLHMVAHHFVAEGGLRNYLDVLAYVSNPAIFTIEIIFLLVVTPHAMLGVRAVLIDLGLSQQTSKTIDRLLTVVGIIIIVYGVWLAVALQQAG
jgi:succinate dehydrogenase hydrophobic anchor subunit